VPGTDSFPDRYEQLTEGTQPGEGMATTNSLVFSMLLCWELGTLWLGGYDVASTSRAPAYVPLVSFPTFYFVNVHGIDFTAAGPAGPIGHSTLSSEASPTLFFVDSGTSQLLLPSALYADVVQYLGNSTGWTNLTLPAGFFGGQDCYPASLYGTVADVNQALPWLHLDMDEGVTLLLPPVGSYLSPELAADAMYYCPGISAAEGATGILGAAVMNNYVVVFDRTDNVFSTGAIGWAPSPNCTGGVLNTPSNADVLVATATVTRTATQSPTASASATLSYTNSGSITVSRTIESPTASATDTDTASATATATATATASFTPSATNSYSMSATASATASATPTVAAVVPPTASGTAPGGGSDTSANGIGPELCGTSMSSSDCNILIGVLIALCALIVLGIVGVCFMVYRRRRRAAEQRNKRPRDFTGRNRSPSTAVAAAQAAQRAGPSPNAPSAATTPRYFETDDGTTMPSQYLQQQQQNKPRNAPPASVRGRRQVPVDTSVSPNDVLLMETFHQDPEMLDFLGLSSERSPPAQRAAVSANSSRSNMLQPVVAAQPTKAPSSSAAHSSISQAYELARTAGLLSASPPSSQPQQPSVPVTTTSGRRQPSASATTRSRWSLTESPPAYSDAPIYDEYAS